MTAPRTVKPADTICWTCRRPGTGTCSWDKSLTPVEGWTATVQPWSVTTTQRTDSYIVHRCPLYEEDDHGSPLY